MTRAGSPVRGVVKMRRHFYYCARVPKRFAGLVLGSNGQPVQQVRIALHTDSLAEANAKAPKVAEQIRAEWEALAAGDAGRARDHYTAARKLAEARGFPYVPLADLAAPDASLEDLVRRVLSLADPGGNLASSAVVDAVLGAVPPALPTLSEVWDEYCDLTRTQHMRKSEAQLEKWKNPRRRALDLWTEVCGDIPLDRITRADALKFRKYWSDRIAADDLTPQYANKIIGHLSAIFRAYDDAHALDLKNPFKGLALKGETDNARPAFSLEWVRDRLLAPGALDGLNDEARDVLLVMVNTGLRPSEITDAPLADWHLSANVPYLAVTPTGRELKVAHTRREIPLLGVSLEAGRRIVARGGCTRYLHGATRWSAAVGKYLRENGLAESPRHTPYSLRHYIENRLQATGADDRVRADILGHRYARPRYGDGGAVAGRAAALVKIAL